jgi:hypothetical protein
MAVYSRLQGSFRDADAEQPRQSVAGGGKAVVWIDDFVYKSLNEGSDTMDYEDWEKWYRDQQSMGGLARRYNGAEEIWVKNNGGNQQHWARYSGDVGIRDSDTKTLS